MIYIASDYRGFQLKSKLITFLTTQLNLKVKDLGPTEVIPEDDAIDYAVKVSREVIKNKENRGILICDSGHGMCISANKINGVRASIGYNIEGAKLMRLHDDANIICLAGHILTFEHASAIIRAFLETEFEPLERRVRRLKKLEKLEESIK